MQIMAEDAHRGYGGVPHEPFAEWLHDSIFSNSLKQNREVDKRVVSRRKKWRGQYTLSNEHIRLMLLSRAVTYSIKASPATASIRLIPDAIPCSEIILKPRISEVLLTCVPPQSSNDTPGTSTTLTCKIPTIKIRDPFSDKYRKPAQCSK